MDDTVSYKVITVRVTDEQHERYKVAARDAEVSLNKFVISAVEAYLAVANNSANGDE